MDAESRTLILDRCAESRKQNIRLRALLPDFVPSSLRVEFAKCAIDLALEHHSAFIRLIEAEEYGSAAALLRPIFEASTIGFWFVYEAPIEKIQRLPRDGQDNPVDDVPMLLEMANDLKKTFPPIQTIVDGFKSGGPAKWLHKYAHGGTPQLNRRHGSGWQEGDVMLGLIRADMFCVLAGCLETVLAPNPALTAYGFPRRDELAEELSFRFDLPAVEAQPHTLPSSSLLGAE
jgi:phage tail protein X